MHSFCKLKATYTFCSSMYLLESAVMSGMDPLNGRAPEQKIFPFSFKCACTKIKFGIKQADDGQLFTVKAL